MGFSTWLKRKPTGTDTVSRKKTTVFRMFEKGDFTTPEIGHLLRGDYDKLRESPLGQGLLRAFAEAAQDPTDFRTEALSKVSQAAMGGTADPMKTAEASMEAESSGQAQADAERRGGLAIIPGVQAVQNQSQAVRAGRMQDITSRGRAKSNEEGVSGFDKFLLSMSPFLKDWVAGTGGKEAAYGTGMPYAPVGSAAAAPIKYEEVAYGGYGKTTQAFPSHFDSEWNTPGSEWNSGP